VIWAVIKYGFVGLMLIVLLAGSEVSVSFNASKVKEKKSMFDNIGKGFKVVKQITSVF